MKKMIQRILLLICLYFSSISFAETRFTSIVFFGASHTDNGNLYNGTLGIIPKSPPYYKGRFSNGPVWSERLADSLMQKNIRSENYAVGGETVLFHNPFERYLPYRLQDSLNKYFLEHLFKDKSKTLFIFWIGGNDYNDKTYDIDLATTAVLNEIKNRLVELIQQGAKYFLILNLPDLSMTPKESTNNENQKLKLTVQAHNQKLMTAISDLNKTYQLNIEIFDVYSLVNDLLLKPDKYNQLYNLHLNDLKNPCWIGGLTLEEEREMARLRIISSLCSNPEEHIFWDDEHYTQSVHIILFKEIQNFIEKHYDAL